ncbi:NAD(P)H-dependent oxidoreductase [Propionivibrio dicarboxylicus]|uniref:Predicted homoserine dehydrogenase, contains C-terminal SAF domain n=1 Tax=Propionivibrio dicarboxylicus TaxID=83767 RepID=A0A1G8AC72_9RHOO|nr:flagellar biosynthesis protein FlgA [Propionivibrio dicarboxylicus]SDH18625.1 Predicted homoserine dehydrogenase, contains C-terminal SAF domain [Propionivibrio dicarboxylicus]
MNHLDYFASATRPVDTCVVGSGGFGRSFLAQARRVPLMRARIAVDVDATVAAAGFAALGLPADAIAVCASAAAAREAWERGQYIAAADLATVIDLPFDVLVEATGSPEAGARHARLAIEADRHVVLVSKEVDSVVGPILAHLATERGKVVTPVDGDQPSLLIGLITWAQTLGFDILAAGKSSEYDFICDADAGTVVSDGKTFAVPGLPDHWHAGARAYGELARDRAQTCAALPQRAVPDLCELLVVANATGFVPDRPDLHAPIARIPEVPDFFGPADEGGLLSRTGILDVFHCLRRPDEASFAGGVFVIVACDDAASWELLLAKGHVVSRDGRRALIYLPRHLLGLEAATSVLDVAIHGRSTGARSPRPCLDLVTRATRPLAAGSVLAMGGHHHTIDGTTAELLPAGPLGADQPLPFYLAANRRLVRDVAAGALLTLADVDIDPASELLALRRQQDTVFFGGARD